MSKQEYSNGKKKGEVIVKKVDLNYKIKRGRKTTSFTDMEPRRKQKNADG